MRTSQNPNESHEEDGDSSSITTTSREATNTELNLIVYSMATNEPALQFHTSSVPLSLGVTADLGKLYLAAVDVRCDDWRVSMYIDSHPNHRLIHLYRLATNTDTLNITNNTSINKTHIESELLPDTYEKVKDRVREFIKESYTYKDANNVLIIQGHGDPQLISTFHSVGILSDGSSDSLRITDLARDIKRLHVNSPSSMKPFKVIALDSCCLATLENVVTLMEVTDYIVAFQDEAPWNGFVNAYLLELLCGDEEWPKKLVGVMQVYAHDALSQDKPSGMSLLATEHSNELLELVRVVTPLTAKPQPRDIVSYVLPRTPTHTQQRLKQLLGRVLLAHVMPENAARRREQRNGLNVFV